MTRIFMTLALACTVLIGIAFFLGLNIGETVSKDRAVIEAISRHMLAGLLGLLFVALVHAIVLTYFMGTGRWLEETSKAYKLSPEFHRKNQALKYRLLPGMTVAILVLVMTGAFGAAADPATWKMNPEAVASGSTAEDASDEDRLAGVTGPFGFAPATIQSIHFWGVCVAIAVNLLVHMQEFRSLERNAELIDGVMSEVTRIRKERELPV